MAKKSKLQTLADGSMIGTVTGTVSQVSGNRITFKAASGAVYAAEAGMAKLSRKNGAVMLISEVLPLDKVEVFGRIWRDNSMNAETVRNLSLYAHTGTFAGKISSISPADSGFVMESRQYGRQTVRTTSFTAFLKNNSAAAFKDLLLGASAKVRGTWDRSRADMSAQEVAIAVRPVSIDITGELMMKGDFSLTVISNSVIYGADITGAKLSSKNNKPLAAGQLGMGDTLRVRGKHLPESVQITASSVKDLSLAVK